jgi:hypothetical protein
MKPNWSFRTIAALPALLSLPWTAHAADNWDYLNKNEETIRWAISASGRCPKIDKDGRWLEGTCVQLVTKVTSTMLRAFVPDSKEIVNGLLEIVRCERGQKSAGGTAPFLASCVERKGEAAARQMSKWRELRVNSPDLPSNVPDAPMPKADESLFR